MNVLLPIAKFLSRFVAAIGKAGAWVSILMIVVILTDVILRRYFVIGSAKLQELEWHLHGILFLTTLGYGYLEGAHVRIELFREKWSARTKAWVELFGILLFLLPFTLTAIYFGIDYVEMSYLNSEVSAWL
ncbi:MAG: TRAP transporter small permease subunit, partial [Proteobacteria bacterium]|nr:TRAP transporter small permease subunit [Pseudomonadota bacterium]